MSKQSVSMTSTCALRPFPAFNVFRSAFLNDLSNLAPAEPLPDGPRQEDQRQLAEMARAKSAAAKKAALAGQGNLFGEPVEPLRGPVPVAELQEAADAMQFHTAQDTPHEYLLVGDAESLRQLVGELSVRDEFCFDTETTGLDIFNDRILAEFGFAEPGLHLPGLTEIGLPIDQ